MITRKSLPRRTFLRGTGVTIALPLLDAMVPALSSVTHAAGKTVRRLGIVYVPNGIAMQYLDAEQRGNRFRAVTDSAAAGAHARPTGRRVRAERATERGGAILPRGSVDEIPDRCARAPDGRGHGGWASIDQLVARTVGEQTLLASLELAVDARDISGSCDGASCAFLNTVSWSSTTTALPTEHDPRVVFERMFGESGIPIRPCDWPVTGGIAASSIQSQRPSSISGVAWVPAIAPD